MGAWVQTILLKNDVSAILLGDENAVVYEDDDENDFEKNDGSYA